MTGSAPVPPELTGLAAVLGDGSILEAPVEAEILYAGAVDPGNDEACDPLSSDELDGTVVRRTRSLMEYVGAGSRMQLAYEASRRGWI